MKKMFRVILAMTLLLSLPCVTFAMADPVSSGAASGSAEESSQIDMKESGGSGSLDGSKQESTTPSSVNAREVNISSATVVAKEMLHNYVPDVVFKPEISLTVNGKRLVEGQDYELLYNDSSSMPNAIGEYSVLAKAIEGSGYSGICEVGTYGLYDTAVVAGKAYYLINKANTNLVLDAAKNPPVSGANVSVYNMLGGANQAWEFELGKDGYYTIRNHANSSLVLDAAKTSPISGANVSVYKANGGLNQKWILQVKQDGSSVIINAANSSLVLDAAKTSPISGANVSVYNMLGGSNQSWTIKDVSDLSLMAVDMSGSVRNYTGDTLRPSVSVSLFGEALVEDEDYTVLFNGQKSLPIDIGTYEVSVVAKGPAVSGEKKVGSFTICPGLDFEGECRIQSAANTNLVLDASKEEPVSGANISVYLSNGGKNQDWFFAPNSDGTYSIMNAANPELVLDAAKEIPSSGANVSAYLNNGGLNQKWVIQAYSDIYKDLDNLAADNVDVLTDGMYTIYMDLGSKPVLDVDNASVEDGANIQVEPSRAEENQVWEVTHDSNYVLLRNVRSGKYLSVENSRSSSGANVVQTENKDSRSAKWIASQNNDGTYTLYSALFTSLCLDVYKGNDSAGTNVGIYSDVSSSAQRFGFIETPAVVQPCEDVLDTEGFYYIKSATDESMQFDVEGASKENRANIQLWAASNSMWQMFKFKYVDGYYQIINAYTNKALDVDYNSLVPGSNVISYDAGESSDNQLWTVRQNENGTYSFINKKNGLMLEVDGSANRGSNVQTGLEKPSSFDQQSFELEKVTHLMPSGLFSFTSALSGNMALDVTSASRAENANVEIWTRNGSFAQKWWVQSVEGLENTYTLQAVCSGKYLTDNGQGNAVQASEGESASAQWVPDIVDGYYVLTNLKTNRVLDVANSDMSPGTNVCTWAYTGGMNQLWSQVSTSPITSGTYIIRSLSNNDQVFDISGGSTANKVPVVMWKYNGGGNQKYNITSNSDGTYTIVNCASKKAIDAESAAAVSGTRIVQYAKNNGLNQRWRIEYTGDGGFKLVSAMDSSLVIGFNGAASSNGPGLLLVEDNGTKAQHFTFEATTYVPPMPADRQAMLNRINGNSSGTQWLIAVDRSTHKVGVFKGSANNWSLQHYWSCVTGAPSTPTITGTYRTTGFTRPSLSTDSRAIYCTQIWGGYFFHSILASENELGKSLSHGCIRLPYSSANWIYNNIHAGTTVVIYN